MVLADQQQAVAGAAASAAIWDWGTIASVGFAFTALGSAITFIWGRGGKAALMQQQVKDAHEAAAAANKRADALQVSIDVLLASLNAHMVTDAASFAELKAMAGEASRISTSAEIRLTASIDKLGERVDNMAEQFSALAVQLMARLPLSEHAT